MRFVIQRVNSAQVTADGKLCGKIDKGFLVLIGVCEEDTAEIADKMVKKLCGLRTFPEDQGKTNLSLQDVGGELLLVSQFTLYADCKKGYRPSFTRSGDPDRAEQLYLYIVEEARKMTGSVKTGVFGASMKVTLENDGPFTIILDSDEIMAKPVKR